MEKKPIYNKETGRHEIDGIDFDGHFVEWGFSYEPKTYFQEKMHELSVSELEIVDNNLEE